MTSKILDDLKDTQKLAQTNYHWVLNSKEEGKGNYAKDLANIYNLNTLEPLLEDPKCSSCGQMATNRCSRCKGEWYCRLLHSIDFISEYHLIIISRPCQVNAWKTHKQVCDILSTKNPKVGV